MRRQFLPAGRLAGLLVATLLAGATPAPAARAGEPDPLFEDGFETPPIVAPAGTWSFVPFANAFCGNNTTTGIGINPSPNPANNRVLLFLAGGGACWDATTCLVLQTAANFHTGYGAGNFNNDVAGLGAGFFDRASTGNPFRDYSYVFVPYCTGDVHAGDNVVSYSGQTRRHVGYANIGAYLERLVPTFRSAGRVVLAGASAGGFGATLNWERVQRAFGNVRVDMIDDSGTLMPASIVPPSNPNELLRASAWNLAATIPTGCTACANGLDNIYTYYATTLPNNRGALLSYRPDSTIAGFYQISQAAFSNGLNQVLPIHYDPFPSKRYFIANGPGHVLFGTPGLVSGGVTLQSFLNQMVNDDPAWSNVTP